MSKIIFKSEEQKGVFENIKLLFEVQQAAIRLFIGCASIASEAKHKIKYGEALKIP